MLRSSVPGKTSKVLICGYRSSGKTSILEQVIYGNFPCYAYPTIEDIYCALVNTDRGLKEKLRFYDTAGTVPGQSSDFLKTYMTYAEGVILVYAINSRESFSLLDQVKKEYDKTKEKKEVPIIVLGNKMDLQNERQVDTGLAQAWAQKEKVKLYEVSALDRRTLVEPFVYLASKMNPPPSKSTFPQLGKKGKPGSITMEL
ncbi:NF-kappa-B inhibitor-interacting Ras-like protein 2 [Caerostris darwini]|uniref:NF-kappa-B inhibitor-interacting Ras-like protein 2 n=2 Tax=Caerostris TaxID=172845 RepID=A0AAV4MQV4_9ARAC|nr:NF-kappa-B inhibitor-interacting Ras-like protein 2 [Caerostris darwini]GIX83940.1 NF-kappa-B inhibitor-interacting Ras-like protein 2 [Caerostris extrusa]